MIAGPCTNEEDKNMQESGVIFALPKGRIQEECLPLLSGIDFHPEQSFIKKDTRKLQFTTNLDSVSIIEVRSFDVATFVSNGVCDIGICGSDVIEEFSLPDVLVYKKLNIGKCRISIAGANANFDQIIANKKLLTVATKYPNITKSHFNQLNLNANLKIIKLNGAIEIITSLGYADFIVDLVSTGKTLKDNGLHEIRTLHNVESCLIINKNSLRFKRERVLEVINKFSDV